MLLYHFWFLVVEGCCLYCIGRGGRCRFVCAAASTTLTVMMMMMIGSVVFRHLRFRWGAAFWLPAGCIFLSDRGFWSWRRRRPFIFDRLLMLMLLVIPVVFMLSLLGTDGCFSLLFGSATPRELSLVHRMVMLLGFSDAGLFVVRREEWWWCAWWRWFWWCVIDGQYFLRWCCRWCQYLSVAALRSPHRKRFRIRLLLWHWRMRSAAPFLNIFCGCCPCCCIIVIVVSLLFLLFGRRWLLPLVIGNCVVARVVILPQRWCFIVGAWWSTGRITSTMFDGGWLSPCFLRFVWSYIAHYCVTGRIIKKSISCRLDVLFGRLFFGFPLRFFLQ